MPWAAFPSNNLQDLKTGLLVGATPWKQQVSLLVGVVMGALAIPPVLALLNRAYGFSGAVVNPHALPAPQATLISTLASGVIHGKLAWGLIGAGAALGVVTILLDETLGAARRLRLPPLAVGLGIYLPASTTLPIALGALVGFLYRRHVKNTKKPEAAERFGVLAASGMIVGESIFGVLLAGLIVASGKAAPLALAGESFAPMAAPLGSAAFVLCIAGLYTWIGRARKTSA